MLFRQFVSFVDASAFVQIRLECFLLCPQSSEGVQDKDTEVHGTTDGGYELLVSYVCYKGAMSRTGVHASGWGFQDLVQVHSIPLGSGRCVPISLKLCKALLEPS